jgi:hypothetical protein
LGVRQQVNLIKPRGGEIVIAGLEGLSRESAPLAPVRRTLAVASYDLILLDRVRVTPMEVVTWMLRHGVLSGCSFSMTNTYDDLDRLATETLDFG